MTKRTGFGLIAAIAAVAGLIAMISVASASPATVALSSTTVTTGANATVQLSVTPTGTEEVGALTIDITYPAGLTAVSCTNTAAAAAACNTAFAADTIRYTLAGTSAVSGNIADIVFGTSAEGTFPLTVTIQTCADVTGTDLTCTATNGSVVVQAATPTPTPSPTPVPATPTPTLAPATATPTRTPTPAALPPTGGVSSDGSGDGLAWVLGFFGLAVLAGGVWAVSRTRRHTA